MTERQVYRGPNVYGYEPMIRFQVDLGALEEFPTSALPGFNEALIALLPTLHNHGCSYKEPGGLIRRMQEGTWLGHVIEHVALDLQSLVGRRVTYGKTRSVKGQPGVYNVLYAYQEERLGMAAGAVALRLVDSLLPDHLRGVQGWSCCFLPAKSRSHRARRSTLKPRSAPCAGWPNATRWGPPPSPW
ncbi:hypothetical protein ACFSC4_23960 [Deinococcus malanensis]|uniref:cyanophycin synthetase family protein n=1 Tax=Deinococcus malanensis TaxID=1706855 RepID=UPI00362701D7